MDGEKYVTVTYNHFKVKHSLQTHNSKEVRLFITSGPVNAHLIPGIFSNSFIHIHVGAGTEYPLGTKF